MNIRTQQLSFNIKKSKILRIFLVTSLSLLILYLYHTRNEIRYTQEQIMDDQILKRLGQLEIDVRNNYLDKKVHGVNSVLNTSDVGGNHVTAARSRPNERKIKNTGVPGIKYILQWTDSKTAPFEYMGKGQQGFIERKCEYINCFVTDNRSFLGDVTKFDVVAFAGPQLLSMQNKKAPKHRSPLQKYVFASIESAENYPVCNNNLDNFFNWTWTYKLNSESKWGYIVVRDSKGNIIGPKPDMNWINQYDMDPVSDEVLVKLRNKKKAAAWFVSNCNSRSEREKFAGDLHNALKAYNLGVDIFGRCGPFDCGRDRKAECGKMLERDYYFYLSFENSFAEDYVTEKLIHGLRNYALPVVYGGANYSRFLPEGSYLNARELGPARLAKEMKFLIDNPERYKEYFRWRNHYSFHTRSESVETDDYCGFCKLLNNEELVRKTSIYTDFKKWWTPPHTCRVVVALLTPFYGTFTMFDSIF